MNSIAVLIPTYNEAPSIAQVLKALPSSVTEVVVIDNGSSDQTTEIAKTNGATVLYEARKGYGYACLKGMEYLENNPPELVVFLDGDYSDHPEELDQLVAPLQKDDVDFVLGARVKSLREKGSLTPQQHFGNWLACLLMRWLYNSRFTDLGPFRAIRWETLQSLEMQDKTFGWTVEMQLKVLRRKIPYIELPVSYRKRIGISKVSGTVKGTFMAGYKILGWIGSFYFSGWK
jgi:glycosyltransferase involved in cell wall biosynthesis